MVFELEKIEKYFDSVYFRYRITEQPLVPDEQGRLFAPKYVRVVWYWGMDDRAYPHSLGVWGSRILKSGAPAPYVGIMRLAHDLDERLTALPDWVQGVYDAVCAEYEAVKQAPYEPDTETRVFPRGRSVRTVRYATVTGSVKFAPPLLSHRTKATYFAPYFVTVTARQDEEGTWTAVRVIAEGWKIFNGRAVAGSPGRAFFNAPTGMLAAPQWLKDHMVRLMAELAEDYPPNT